MLLLLQFTHLLPCSIGVQDIDHLDQDDLLVLTGLNTKASLIPHNIHGRPPRGELSEPERDRGVRTEESRRRILGMGGTIEPIREEERSSVLFGMKMSKGPLPPGFTEVARRGFHLRSATPPSLPPIAGS